MFRAVCLAIALIAASLTSAFADDWVAVKLRGKVLQLIDQQWQTLQRGDVVPDSRVVRTLRGARVDFQRDAEVITLGPDTQVQIYDRTGKRFTTVRQYFGEVAVEANVENVQHFAVETPFLAAVVKGTRFVVKSGKTGSRVDVLRGHVAVESEVTHSTTLVSAGQTAKAGQTSELTVSGKGDLPSVVSATGAVVSTGTTSTSSSSDDKSEKSTGKGSGNNGNSGNGNSGNSGNGNSGNNGNGNGNSGNSGNGNSGNGNSGNGNSGNGNSGNGNSGNGNSGNDDDQGEDD